MTLGVAIGGVMVKYLKDRDPQRLEQIRVLFLETYHRLEAQRVYPSIRAIRRLFPIPVPPVVLCEARRALIAAGAIRDSGIRGNRRPVGSVEGKPDPCLPVVDDPREVARLSPRIAAAYAARCRLPGSQPAYRIPCCRIPPWLRELDREPDAGF